MDRFDLIVLGGGPAGYLAAERAGAAGMRVALVEARALGGVCLNEGCIPSKALLHSAKLYEAAAKGKAYGVTASGLAIDHTTVVRRKNKVVKKLVAGVGAKLKAQDVTVFTGEGRVAGRGAEGITVTVAGETLNGARLLVAAGSTPVLPPLPGLPEGLESGFVLTSRELLALTEPPESLVVVGGGVIGLEMAGYFAAIGCRVSVVEMLDKIAGPMEAEVSAALQKALEGKGVEFHLGSRVSGVGGGEVRFENAEGAHSLPAGRVLLSIGRRPAGEGLGLEALGVAMEGGAIVTDSRLRSSVEGIYAAGDINGKSMLAHTAYREAEVAVNHMLGRPDEMRYNAIPAVIYTSSEAASVGETEESAAAKGLSVKAAKLPLTYAGRYVAEVERGEGFCKLLMDTRRGCLVGAHLFGSYASEIIYGAGMMIENETPVEDLRRIVFPHPTVSEILRETLFEL